MTVKFGISNKRPLFHVIHKLLNHSCWFEVEPLQNDEFTLTVKQEQANLVEETLNSLPFSSSPSILREPKSLDGILRM